MNYVVTGCNSDIGKAITRRLFTIDNCRAVFSSRSHIDSKVSREGYIFRDRIDLTKGDDLSKLASSVDECFSEEFTVIHSVGDFWYHKPLEYCSVECANTMMQSQYLTLYGAIQTLIPIMRKKGGGRFIAFSCNSVVYSYPELAPFTASKAAIESLIKCVANEYSGDNIYANAIALPTIRTDKVLISKSQGDLENYISADELATIIIDEVAMLSKYVTGNIIKIFKHSDTFYNHSYFERNPSGRLP